QSLRFAPRCPFYWMLLPGSRDDGITGRSAVASEQAACQGTSRPAGKGISSGRTRWFRVPPSSGDHHRLRGDLAVAGQVLADDIDIVEAPVGDGKNRRVSDAARLEAAELGPLQRECGVDGRGGNHIGQRHAEAKKLRHGGDLVEGRSIDAERVNVGRD